MAEISCPSLVSTCLLSVICTINSVLNEWLWETMCSMIAIIHLSFTKGIQKINIEMANKYGGGAIIILHQDEVMDKQSICAHLWGR